MLTFRQGSSRDASICPYCEHRFPRDHSAALDRPVFRTLYRWNRAVDAAVERMTDWLAFHGETYPRCFCDHVSAVHGSGWTGDLCDCCHPSHA